MIMMAYDAICDDCTVSMVVDAVKAWDRWLCVSFDHEQHPEYHVYHVEATSREVAEGVVWPWYLQESIGAISVQTLPKGKCLLRLLTDEKVWEDGLAGYWAELLDELGRLGYINDDTTALIDAESTPAMIGDAKSTPDGEQVKQDATRDNAPATLESEVDQDDTSHFGTCRDMSTREVKEIVRRCRAHQDKGGRIVDFYDMVSRRFAIGEPKSYTEETMKGWLKDKRFKSPEKSPEKSPD